VSLFHSRFLTFAYLRLTMQTLHLPPEEGEDISRAARPAAQGPLCQPNPTKGNPLDF
jgi:hypothetical protein